MRILVTGSRDWTDQVVIVQALWDTAMQMVREGYVPVLVHGACPTGADHIADMAWSTNQWEVERHPADWDKFGKRAGYLRNKEMVDSGIDVCLAFIKNGSKGATMTLNLADAAGIPTKIYREDD